MPEILTFPTDPGLYWCRNVTDIKGASYCRVYRWTDNDDGQIKRVWRYYNSDFNILHTKSFRDEEHFPGEYIHVPDPDWPELPKPPGRVCLKATNDIEWGLGFDEEMMVITTINENFSELDWRSPSKVAVMAHPANDPDLVAKIEAVQKGNK